MKARKILYLLGAAALLVALAPTTASAQVPGVLPIQGYITDAEGTPYDAEVAIRFNLYDAPTGGAELYSERLSVPVTSGVFTAYLGSVTALDMGLFREHTAVYLGIQIGADAEATPRLPFGTVPFAAVSDSTGSFGGVDADDFPTTVEEWALAACPDTVEELSAILDPIYANPAWDAITGVPADIADGDDGFTTEDELTALLDDNYGNPAWDTITGMPAGFADGMDNGFTTEDELTALLNDNYRAAGWAPGWGDIVGIPAGFADGTDDSTSYSAGDGLTLDGTEFAVEFDGPGEATTAARSDAVEDLEARVEELEAERPQGAPYRWVLFNTYDNHSGQWAMNNRSDLFGGVTPSNWTDSNYRPVHMSANSDILRTFLHNRGWAPPTANLISRVQSSYSSTNGWVYVVLFRIRNTAGRNITWTPRFYVTAYGGWNEWAGVAINGSEVWNSGGNWYDMNYNVSVSMTVPSGRTSTAIFSSTTSPPTGHNMRFIQMSFIDNSLRLPAGLEFVDDLDTIVGNAW
jgi:hypothetical protein